MKSSAPSLCRYCGLNPAIENSHIIPKWLVRLVFKNAITPGLRDSDAMNRLLQDGEKSDLLCLVCEQVFGVWERAASEKTKAGLVQEGREYDASFARFVVSLLWKVGVLRLEECKARKPAFVPKLEAALEVWKGVLSGIREDLGGNPAWFIFLKPAVALQVDQIMKSPETDGQGAPPAINRFFANGMSTEVSTNQGTAVVWVMVNQWLMAGVLDVDDPRDRSAVELSPCGGVFMKGEMPVPPIVLAHLGYQSRRYVEETGQVSKVQRDKTIAEWEKRSTKIPGSFQAQAFRDDIAQFGGAAFIELPLPSAKQTDA